MINPLFKWAGGKRKMLAKYEPILAEQIKDCEVFVDMFAGAGTMSVWALSLNPGIKKIIFNDSNPELIHMYRVMKGDCESFLSGCKILSEEYMALPSKEDRKALYLSWRDEYADGDPEEVRKAVLLFCMLKTNFNGIWQSRSKDGVYYTPFGNGNEKENFLKIEEIESFIQMLDKAEIICGSFEEIHISKEEAQKAFFYADPPYLKSHTKYRRKAEDGIFGIEETQQLLWYLYGCNAKFAVSNKEHEIFEGFRGAIHIFNNIKYTASRRDTEGATSNEVLLCNF